jgi:hypothetical protein
VCVCVARRGAIQALTKGAVFGWGHAASMVVLHDATWVSEETKTIISGGAGGLVQGVFMSPILLLKTRVMTNPKVPWRAMPRWRGLSCRRIRFACLCVCVAALVPLRVLVAGRWLCHARGWTVITPVAGL